MYAIFEDGGRQYRVTQGDVVLVDLRDLAAGADSIVFDKVMMVGDGDASRIGQPYVSGATVTGKVQNAALKMAKVRGIKFARRKGLYKRWGHRQQVMKVAIEAING